MPRSDFKMSKVLGYFLEPCVPDCTRNKVSDWTDPALFQAESEPQRAGAQISKQDFSCQSGPPARLGQQQQQHQSSREFI